MAEVVQFAPRRPCASAELIRALEGIIADARAQEPGAPCSMIAVLMDREGREYLVVTGAYRKRGNASNAGFKLQAMAADSSFG